MGSLPTYGLNKVGGCTRAQLQTVAIFLKAHCLPNGTHTLAIFPADIAATQPSEEEHSKYFNSNRCQIGVDHRKEITCQTAEMIEVCMGQEKGSKKRLE